MKRIAKIRSGMKQFRIGGIITLTFVFIFLASLYVLAETDQEKAQLAYKVAVLALGKNDLDVAATKLREAADLDPQNALVKYNLALVLSKQGGHAREAQKILKTAKDLGLPANLKDKVDALEVELAYQTAKDPFVDNGGGTVTDTRTGLMWAAKDNGSDITWDEAKNYCENYRGGGHYDWRMPTMSELEGLYDKDASRVSRCHSDWIVHMTPQIDLSCTQVWSSETAGAAAAWGFNFNDRYRNNHYRSSSGDHRTLPVRSLTSLQISWSTRHPVQFVH